jgi:hypothetical protein
VTLGGNWRWHGGRVGGGRGAVKDIAADALLYLEAARQVVQAWEEEVAGWQLHSREEACRWALAGSSEFCSRCNGTSAVAAGWLQLP